MHRHFCLSLPLEEAYLARLDPMFSMDPEQRRLGLIGKAQATPLCSAALLCTALDKTTTTREEEVEVTESCG